jgi:hypothetical protein
MDVVIPIFGYCSAKFSLVKVNEYPYSLIYINDGWHLATGIICSS